MDHFDGLIAGYKCDGNTDDFSGNDRHATAVGSTFTSPGKIFAQAALHDGIDDYWNLPTIGINQDNQAFSIGGWNNFTNGISTEMMITNGTSDGSHAGKLTITLRRSGAGKIDFIISKTGFWSAFLRSDDVLIDLADTDYFIFATYDGSRTLAGMKIYFADSEVASTSIIGTFGTSAIAFDGWRFGADSIANQEMAGKQNQMLLYDKDVSAARILALYNDGDGLDFDKVKLYRRGLGIGLNKGLGRGL